RVSGLVDVVRVGAGLAGSLAAVTVKFAWSVEFAPVPSVTVAWNVVVPVNPLVPSKQVNVAGEVLAATELQTSAVAPLMGTTDAVPPLGNVTVSEMALPLVLAVPTVANWGPVKTAMVGRLTRWGVV